MSAVAPFGSWKSPITSDVVVAGAVRFGGLTPDGSDLYWTEGRPREGGRTVIVRWSPGEGARDVLPAPFNARSRVHEYGGGAVAAAGGTVYFTNFADQRLYGMAPGREPRPLTPSSDARYADMDVDRVRGRLYCVREDHRSAVLPGAAAGPRSGTAGARAEAVNTLVAVSTDVDPGGGTVIAEGRDFFSSPRLSPDGGTLAWVCWDHPRMPWDGTELWTAGVRADGLLDAPRKVAGGPAESIMEPRWSPRGELCFISDRTGFWNLYRCAAAGDGARIEALCPMDAEIGGPAWVFGGSHYTFVAGNRILLACTRRGFWRLAILDDGARTPRDIALPFSDIDCVRAGPGSAYVIAGSPSAPQCIARLDPADPARAWETIRESPGAAIEPGFLSRPEAVEFPTGGGLTAYGIFYPPRNRDFSPPAGARPPLLVMSHGGPTGQASVALSLSVQFWTSRGIAVLDVNYGGSTGYGREYRERLKGAWGIVDVDDCVNGALHLARQGRVDAERLMIRGGSAGGFTTLAALTFRSCFKAGASYYGIGDLEALVRDTHKFESHNLDGLVGPYPAARDVYRERSPAFSTGRMSVPLIIFQGMEDRVVPPAQAVTMFEALKAKGIPVAYLPFEGEQHGFRRAENIARALEAELYFYSRVLGFALAEPLPPVDIENA
jgi:dipeptidyl aminopeptidase/acylaminoacyl peptidase